MGHRIRIWAQKDWFYPEISGREVVPISVTRTVYHRLLLLVNISNKWQITTFFVIFWSDHSKRKQQYKLRRTLTTPTSNSKDPYLNNKLLLYLLMFPNISYYAWNRDNTHTHLRHTHFLFPNKHFFKIGTQRFLHKATFDY